MSELSDQNKLVKELCNLLTSIDYTLTLSHIEGVTRVKTPDMDYSHYHGSKSKQPEQLELDLRMD